jgi:hypothetical protein
MTGDPLPQSDHVARFCKPTCCNDDGSIAAGAFMLRTGESYLSVQWLECLCQADRAAQIEAAREAFGRRLKVGRSAKMAVLNVGTACSHVMRESGFKIDMHHQPEPADPAHSGIFGISQDEELIAETILEAIKEVHPARKQDPTPL